MDKETFPDVTLADAAVMEQRVALNPPSRAEGDLGKDTFVVLKPKRKGYRVSRRQATALSVVALLVLVVIIIVTTLVNRKLCEHHNGCQGEPGAAPDPSPNATPSGAHLQSTLDILNPGEHEPWSSIRLPRTVLPTDYDIHVRVDLKEFTYHGAVNITVRVNTETKFVVFHRSHIEIDNSSILITSAYFPPRTVVRQSHVPGKNFHILEVNKEMTAGSVYTLTIGHYYGHLEKNLRGLYLSSYEKQDGNTSATSDKHASTGLNIV
ncbi:hypothetical protein Btru_044348 [Bulinus truncatus]|nr:hypothetical protein Btru_044348 [Bulinus truncatus]